MTKSRILLLAAFVALGITILAGYVATRTISFKSDLGTALAQTFGGLTLIALFVERLIEVYVSIWREPGEEAIDTQIKAFTGADGKVIPGKEADLQLQQKAKDEYKSATGWQSTAVGLVFGALVSAVGFRALGSLLDPTTVAALEDWQRKSLIGVDTILTAAVLSGGSDSVHKIFSVYNSFMDATRAKSDAKAKTP